ncbi:MAG: peptidyl-tRNA hydrolase Pth2 [Methanophagales archaeon]|nr:peptidyl-tRNA hydrolase Pth2 [Methanophagales archaeon]MCW3141382.1 peptidyl-tRNA hydrolase Pth2 [Methanophagales archaeon]
MHGEYKQCIVIREDLKLSRGKAAVQAAHASVLSYELAAIRDRKKWKEQGQKKVALKVNNLEELYKLEKEAKKLGLPVAIVEDAGLTEIPPGTVTAIGIGPADAETMDKVTKHLELL